MYNALPRIADCSGCTGHGVIILDIHLHACVVTDLQSLLRYMTGSDSPPPSGFSAGYIAVQFLDTDGVISATCQMKLTLPTRLDNIEEFSACMHAVLPQGRRSFTMV